MRIAEIGIIAVLVCFLLSGCTDKKDFLESCNSEISQQVTDIVLESQKGRYDLENCRVFVTEEREEDGYVIRRMTLQADWKRIREPEDDPLIKGMVQAMEELESVREKEEARKIIDGYIVEIDSEPESETIETNFIAKISPENKTFDLFYPYVQEEQETLVPLGNLRKKTGLKMPKRG